MAIVISSKVIKFSKTSIYTRLEAFNFDLNLRVTGFKLTIAGVGSFDCEGDTLSNAAKRGIDRAGRNAIVQVSNIRTAALGSSTQINTARSVSFTLL